MSQRIVNSLKVSVPDVDPLTTYRNTLQDMLTEKFKEFKELYKKEHLNTVCNYSSEPPHIICDDENFFHYTFVSRNKPPIEVYDSLLEKFSELEFSYHWYDWDLNPSGNDGVFGYSNHIDPKIF